MKANNLEYSEEVKATPMLEGEVELTLANNGSNKFDLTWTQVEGATRYIIYRQYNNEAYQKVLTLGKDATIYTTNKLKEGTYRYIVKAARYDGAERVMTNGSNEVLGISGKVNPVLFITEENGTTVTLTWQKFPGMKYYEVYRAKDGGAYRQVKRTGDAKVYTDFSNEVSYTAQ